MEKFRGCTDNDQRLKVQPGDDADDDDGGHDYDDDDDYNLLNDKCPVGRIEKVDAYSLVTSECCVTNLKIHVFLLLLPA